MNKCKIKTLEVLYGIEYPLYEKKSVKYCEYTINKEAEDEVYKLVKESNIKADIDFNTGMSGYVCYVSFSHNESQSNINKLLSDIVTLLHDEKFIWKF